MAKVREKNEVDCRDANCKRTGVYVETLTSGEKVLCIPGKHHGANHVRKLSLEEVKKMLS